MGQSVKCVVQTNGKSVNEVWMFQVKDIVYNYDTLL